MRETIAEEQQENLRIRAEQRQLMLEQKRRNAYEQVAFY